MSEINDASVKYWEKNGFYQEKNKISQDENRDKANYDKLVSLEAKIEVLGYIENKMTGNEELYYYVKAQLDEYQSKYNNLRKELGVDKAVKYSMEELNLENYRFARKPNGDYIIICEDCGEHKVVEEDLEDLLNDILEDYTNLIQIAKLAQELTPVLSKLLPINRESSKGHHIKISRLNSLIEKLKTVS